MFSRNPIPASQRPEKVPYICHHPHSTDTDVTKWTQNYHQIVSIDPSTKNLGFRIERRYIDGYVKMLVFERISFIPTAKERRAQGLAPVDNPNRVEITPHLYSNVTKFLSKYQEMYRDCHLIIIEQQLIQNYKAVRLSQHVLSYFLITLADAPLLPLIIEISSQEKFKTFGCPRSMSSDRDKKKWLIDRVLELSKYRGDMDSYNVIVKSKTKQDDFADTIAQIEAFYKHAGWPTILNVDGFLKIIRGDQVNEIKLKINDLLDTEIPISNNNKIKNNDVLVEFMTNGSLENIQDGKKKQDERQRPVKINIIQPTSETNSNTVIKSKITPKLRIITNK